MKKLLILLIFIAISVTIGCSSAKKEEAKTVDNAKEPTTIVFTPEVSENKIKDFSITEAIDSTSTNTITDEQALSAIRDYCHISNPDLADIEKVGEYPVYWEIASSDDKEIVVLFRSYTGAQVRYYINPVSGDTYVTEFVPGITEDEERTDESFNVKDYISENDPSAEKVSSVPGTWATASMGYEYNGDVLPEYHVQFTDSKVIYGHMLDGEFMTDHTAKIIDLENTASGGYRIQVESSAGGHYTYQTSDNDDNVLEYYETWDEDDFHSMYRGGASLWKID